MKRKNILIIGSGGREHALGWKLRQSHAVKKIFFAPGNPGTALIGENIPIGVTEIQRLLMWAKENAIDMTIVGPEVPLSLGIVDLFAKHNLPIFGPTQKAARLETSKSWATQFMKRHSIPHPKSDIFSDPKKAKEFIRQVKGEVVIKADGIAAGKGVIIPETLKEALETIDMIMIKKEFGEAGKKILIQEKISGPEVSILAISDGKTFKVFLPVQDHKRVFDNDKGPNTGGMGAYAPVHFVTKSLMNKIKKEILEPTILGLKNEEIPYTGVLYAGLIITKDGPKVIEYNARFGDPETQPLMTLLQSDLYKVFDAALKNKLSSASLRFKKGKAVCVILAAKGYPGNYESGKIIYGLSKSYGKNLHIFHAGTSQNGTNVITSGGRVIGITTFAKDLTRALNLAYAQIDKQNIFFKGMHYRTDIGRKNNYLC